MADLMFPWLFQHSELGLRSLAGTTIEQRTFTTVYVSELRRPVEFTFPGAIGCWCAGRARIPQRAQGHLTVHSEAQVLGVWRLLRLKSLALQRPVPVDGLAVQQQIEGRALKADAAPTR